MIEKQIRVSCSNSINKLKSTVTGKVWRSWRIQIRSIDRDIKSALGVYIDHVEYVLHESFETPRICCAQEPYTLEQEGWGEFDLGIVFHFKDNTIPPQTIIFDLNFLKPKYSVFKSLELNEEYLLLQQRSIISNKNNNRKRALSNASSVDDHSSNSTNSKGRNKKSGMTTARQRATSSASTNSIVTPASSLVTTPADGCDILSCYDDLQHKHQQKEQQQNYYEHYCRSSQTQQQHQEHQQTVVVNHELINNSDTPTTATACTLNQQNHHEQINCSSSTRSDTNNDIELLSWNAAIPEEIDIPTLGHSLESLNDENLREAYNIVFHQEHDKTKMEIIETEDHVLFDLYTLETSCITKLWDFTRHVEQQNQAEAAANNEVEQQQVDQQEMHSL